jgi:hypothetical protein
MLKRNHFKQAGDPRWRGILAVVLVCLAGATSVRANLTLDASEVSLSPSASPQNFFINMTLTNNAVTPVSIVGWQFKLSFSPTIAPSNIAVTGFSNNISPAAAIGSNPATPTFVTTSLFTNSIFVSAAVTVPASSSQTLVNVNMQLAANALTKLYNIAITDAEITFSDFNAEVPTVGTGSIATPEPTVALSLAATLWLSSRRKHRCNRCCAAQV